MNNINKVIDQINRNILDNKEIKKVSQVLRKGLLSRPGSGPIAKEFQKQMAKAHKKKHAYAVTSGTAALHLSVSVLNLKKGDEIIVPALANIADCSAVIQEGGIPVFADIDPTTFNIDLNDIKKKITKRTKAIIVVHMYGEPVKMKEIIKIAKNHKLIVIEDCAQAAGAKYKGKYVGSFGDLSCFSLYQTKHIIAGEGGVILTNKKDWFNKIDSLANNGIKKDDLDTYDYDLIGYNYQMTEMQACLGISQLKKLDKMNKIRRKNVKIYKEQLKDTGITFQKTNLQNENVYFYLTALLPKELRNKRDLFVSKVINNGVPIKKLYPTPLTDTKVIKDKFYKKCIIASDVTERLFNLYVNPGLTKKDINGFCKIIIEVYNNLHANEK